MSANTGFSSLFSSGSTPSTGSSFGSVSRGSSGFTGVGSFARSSPFSRFQSNKFVSGTREFLQSNSIVAKFAFLLLVLLLFVVLLRLGAWIIGLFFQHDSNPLLIDGMVDAPDTLGKMLGDKEFNKLKEDLGSSDLLISPLEIAKTYYQIHLQHRSAWTHELNISSYLDKQWWND